MDDSAAKTETLEQRFNDYGAWRNRLADALESYRLWCESHRPLDSGQELKVLQLVEELRGNALSIALVGEFARGKTELINAIFFADYDRRLLPSAPGRTTMCPTEILYDSRVPPCVRLLPIETRKSALTLLEQKNKAVNWTTLPLDLGSPAEMARTLGEILRSKQIDRQQARELGLAALAEEVQGDRGQIEVPVWRHAVINYPHRLLAQGVVILDTPGLNALGAEPELTLGMLPDAHAVLFVLAADTGVTMTDMEIWNNHVCPATSRNPASRIVALNKIDTLWDELESPEITAGFIDRQVEETRKLLQIDRQSVFPVSAQKGLVGKIRKGEELVARSGLPELEDKLSELAVKNRQGLVCEKMARDIGLLVHESRELVRRRHLNLDAELQEVLELGSKSNDVIDEMTARLRDQRKRYETEVQSFNATRRLLSEQVKRMIGVLSASRFDERIARTRYAMENSWTTPGLTRGMQTFFKETYDDLKKVDAKSEEIRKLADRIYDRFHRQLGLAIPRPTRYSTGEFMLQFQRLFGEADAFRRSAAMMMTEQHFVVKKFFIVLVSRARLIFQDCNAATRNWAKAMLTPIYAEIDGHKELIDQRIQNLVRLRNNHAALRGRQQELTAEIGELDEQAKFIDGILRSIERSRDLHA